MLDHCIMCGKTFEPHNEEKYCSDKCKSDIENNKFKKGSTIVKCLFCGKEFKANNYSIKTGKMKYCNEICESNYDKTSIKNKYTFFDDHIEMKLKNRHGTVKNCIIDVEDYDTIKFFKWNLIKDKQTYYAATNIKIDGVYKIARMHSVILGNFRSGIVTDHINHDGLDNRKSNLRECSSKDNTRNRKKQQKTKHNLPFKGVSITTYSRKYTSHIRYNDHLKSLGDYIDPIDAAIAYDYAATILFKEFAHVNFPFLIGHYDEVPQYIIDNVITGISGSYKSKCTSMYHGVTRSKYNTYMSAIKHDGRTMRLGTYNEEIDAAYARDLYVIKHNLKRKLNFTITEIITHHIDNYFKYEDI